MALVFLILPAAAAAAGCTDNYTGPAEGSWKTAGNWSAGHIPTSADVACIGSGKTAKVTEAAAVAGAVQGEGAIYISGSSLELANPSEPSAIKSLTLTLSGTLTGPGTLSISGTLNWPGESTMSGSGSTVILPGASVSVGTSAGGRKLVRRRLVNEGTFTLTGAIALVVSEGGEVLNTGAFIVNSEFTTSTKAIRAGTGTSHFVNTGTFEKTAGSGKSSIGVSFENKGSVICQSGRLAFYGGGSSAGSNTWESAGGRVQFLEGSYALHGGSMSGTIDDAGDVFAAGVSVEGVAASGATLEVNAGTLTVEGEPMTVKGLGLRGNGIINGAGTLKVSEAFSWSDVSGMNGAGATVLLPGASGSDGTAPGTRRLTQRRFVNQGTFVLSGTGNLQVSEGGEIVNSQSGTFIANAEPPTGSTFKIIAAGTGGSKITNSGVFTKTEGSGTTKVQVNFWNLSILSQTSGKLNIEHPTSVGATEKFGKNCHSGDPVNCATGDFAESQTDIAVGGRGIGLDLTRTYSAKAAAAASSPATFGYGWTGSFSDHLAAEESGAKVTLTRGDGSTVPFTQVGGTSYSAPSWSQETLSGSTEAGYTFTTVDQTQYRFSGTGRLEGIADRNGNETTLSYSEAGRLASVTDPAGRQLTFAYNAGGQVESVKDPMGHVVKYGYEGGKLASVTMPGEATARWQFKYDTSHRITQVTDGRGGKTTNEYDGSNRVISQTDPAGRTMTFSYEAFHTTITNKATGEITDERFTSDNEPYSITRGSGTVSATTETFDYNEAGQIAQRTDGNGHTTTYGYDEAGNRTSEKDPLGHETKWTYNATHDPASTTLPGGETTTIKRDSHGNVESISRPAPGEATQTTSFVHDEHGQLTSVTDPLERTWTYGYDAYGNRTTEVDPLGETRTLAYDKDSQLVAIVSPSGNLEGAEPGEYETTIERDAQGRPLKITDPLGHATEYSYDGNGNLSSLTDAKGHTTKYTYNGDDEQTKVEKPNGATLETGYDGAGFVTSQTNGNGKTTTYVRNVLEQPVEVIDPLGRKTLETFDAAGNLIGLTDPAERKTTYSYDAADSLTGVGYSEEATPDASFEYDADGNLTAMTDGSGESSFAYDQLGRLTRSEDGHGDVVEYGYDLADQQTGVVYPNGKGVSRTYDGAGRLESITDWLGGTTTFGYDADSNLTGISFPAESGNSDEYTYDRASLMSEAKFKKGSETLASLSYLRDPLGQVEEEARNGLPGPEAVSYGYDKNSRLIEAGAASFEYDGADNLTKGNGSTNTYDAGSQLEAGTGVTYSYDKLGERVKASSSSGPATSYGYNQAGNLTSINRPEAGEVSGIAESFAYDGTGLLVSKTSGLTTKHLAWDSSAALPLLLDDEDNSYVFGPNDLLIEQISSAEEPTYLHHDQLGSTRMLTDAGGETSATFSYAPYGGLEGRTGTATTRFGFADQYTDAETGLQYLRARFYDPETGQFLTRDPIDALTGQPYSYGFDNPLTQVDPSGMFAIAGALGCLAGPEAAAVCAGIGTTAACAAISPCRNAAEEAAHEVASLFEGEDSSDESSSQDAEPCQKEIGDARQAMDSADKFVQQLLSATGGGPPGGSRGRAIIALVLIVINAVRNSG